ncbi:MAG: YbaN family protein [Bacteroidales bacterium]|nr:YbaN family protein [Bacteroidales bacterium]
MDLLKPILILIGTLSLCLGLIGIVVPGLPTTPFLLLTAGLYLRSSDRLYQKLISSKYVGPYVTRYHASKGLTKRDKISAIVTMWCMIALSCLLFIASFKVRVIVILVGITGTLVMGWLIPTVPDSGTKENY